MRRITLILKAFSRRAAAALILSSLGAAMLGACAHGPAARAAEAAPQVQSSAGSDYIVGPGDTIQVYVWRNPELTVTVPVRPDGKISVPLVEDMVAVGKTPTVLARDIESVLSEFVKSPKVNVIVTNPVSAFSKVRVIGQVGQPQSIPFREGMTVLDALLQVGGLSQFAAGNRAKIIRTENGKERELKVKLESLVDKADMRQNIALRPGDVIIVPESRF